MNIILFGAPGVGKGTQAEVLAERLGIAHISTGAIFRENISRETELGLRVKRFLDDGLLVPNELTTAIALDAVGRAEEKGGFILDGFPRNIEQAEALSASLSEDGKKIDRVIYLTAPAEEITARMLKRGRPDDTEEVIRTRLEVYDNETAPVLGFFRDLGLVTEVYGVGEIQEVHERVMSAIGAAPGEGMAVDGSNSSVNNG